MKELARRRMTITLVMYTVLLQLGLSYTFLAWMFISAGSLCPYGLDMIGHAWTETYRLLYGWPAKRPVVSAECSIQPAAL